ncbi:RNA-binding protein [Bacillus cereus]|nr:RNA-binding protein [Bacillus cereus]
MKVNSMDQMIDILYGIIPTLALFLGFIISTGLILKMIKKLIVGDAYSYSGSMKSDTYSSKVNLNKSSYSNSGSKKSSNSSSSNSSNSDYLIATSLAASSYSSYDSGSSCSNSSSYDSGSSSSYDSGSSCGFGD